MNGKNPCVRKTHIARLPALMLAAALVLSLSFCRPAPVPEEEPPKAVSSSATLPDRAVTAFSRPEAVAAPSLRNTGSGYPDEDFFSCLLVHCARALVYDWDEDCLYYCKNVNQRCEVASTVKLLTSLVALSVMPEDYVITVGSEVYLAKSGSSLAYLKFGNELTLRQLLYALLLPSGNDAAFVLAVNVAKYSAGNRSMKNADAVALFVEMMNDYAASLGCTDTHFSNPDGWEDPENQYTTMLDMLRIAKAAFSNETLLKTMSTPSRYVTMVSGQSRTWNNTNSMIRKKSVYYNPHCIAGKTGTTDTALCCLVTLAELNGHRVITLVYGAEKSAYRFTETEILYNAYLQYTAERAA